MLIARFDAPDDVLHVVRTVVIPFANETPLRKMGREWLISTSTCNVKLSFYIVL